MRKFTVYPSSYVRASRDAGDGVVRASSAIEADFVNFPGEKGQDLKRRKLLARGICTQEELDAMDDLQLNARYLRYQETGK